MKKLVLIFSAVTLISLLTGCVSSSFVAESFDSSVQDYYYTVSVNHSGNLTEE